jgi:hypothetical protein
VFKLIGFQLYKPFATNWHALYLLYKNYVPGTFGHVHEPGWRFRARKLAEGLGRHQQNLEIEPLTQNWRKKKKMVGGVSCSNPTTYTTTLVVSDMPPPHPIPQSAKGLHQSAASAWNRGSWLHLLEEGVVKSFYAGKTLYPSRYCQISVLVDSRVAMTSGGIRTTESKGFRYVCVRLADTQCYYNSGVGMVAAYICLDCIFARNNFKPD